MRSDSVQQMGKSYFRSIIFKSIFFISLFANEHAGGAPFPRLRVLFTGSVA
eukprot:XP_001704466.1 Hypothetical protein GL50803_5022 [Giardia lamblia ATCC 50803]